MENGYAWLVTLTSTVRARSAPLASLAMDYNWDTLLCLLRATLLLVHFKWRGPLTALWESSLA